jgi:hypothetical protein
MGEPDRCQKASASAAPSGLPAKPLSAKSDELPRTARLRLPASVEANCYRTPALSTMSDVLEELRDEPDPDGSMTFLADRITVDREWVRALMALGEQPRRPPGWLRRLQTAGR